MAKTIAISAQVDHVEAVCGQNDVKWQKRLPFQPKLTMKGLFVVKIA
ncbi:MAG: hypothetical protein QM296_05645 [Bacillota bacterium]|nr:hypothetical protein [Bacillota bacterium]